MLFNIPCRSIPLEILHCAVHGRRNMVELQRKGPILRQWIRPTRVIIAEWLDQLELSAGGTHQRNPQSRLLRMRSEEHTSERQSLMRISYAVFCMKKQLYNLPNQYKLN